MTPRRNRTSRGSRDERGVELKPIVAARTGAEWTDEWNGVQWRVRTITSVGAAKQYRCPGCDHEIAQGVAHLVVWPAEYGSLDDRRHWHTACWRARATRPPGR